jgi:hypothetical protein
MPPGKVVAVDFNSDDTLQIACQYREATVYPALVGLPAINGKNVLTNNQANKASVDNALQDASVVYITGVAHGAADSFPGNSDDPPVFATTIGGYDPALIKGRILHLLSCNTADLLGRALADPNGGGASAFFGYKSNFTWPTNVDQRYANIFFNCDAQIDLVLAAGKNADQAYVAAVQMYQSQHDELVSEGTDESLFIASMLETNKDMLCAPSVDSAYGSTGATLGAPGGSAE